MITKTITRERRREVYETVSTLASQAGLISQGAGGVFIVVHPDTQDEEGLTKRCLQMAQIKEVDDAQG